MTHNQNENTLCRLGNTYTVILTNCSYAILDHMTRICALSNNETKVKQVA